MSARPSKSPPQRNTCRYCGVEGGGNHPSERECVEALTAEIEKARRLLVSHRPSASPECLTAGIGARTRTTG